MLTLGHTKGKGFIRLFEFFVALDQGGFSDLDLFLIADEGDGAGRFGADQRGHLDLDAGLLLDGLQGLSLGAADEDVVTVVNVGDLDRQFSSLTEPEIRT